MKVIFNEEEYEVNSEQTVDTFFESKGYHINYLTKEEELVAGAFTLVEIDGELKNAQNADIYDGMNISTKTDQVKAALQEKLMQVITSDDFKCLVVPLGEELPEEFKILIKGFVIQVNYDSGYQEYYPLQEIDYTERIKSELVNPVRKVVALIARQVKNQLSTEALANLYQELKSIGFQDIIDVDLGLKLKAIEEVDYLAKLLVEKMDGKADLLPLIISDEPELYCETEALFPELNKLLSPVKFGFQIEAHIYKKSEKDAYLVYVTNNTITNANCDYYVNEDIDGVLSVNQLAKFSENTIKYQFNKTDGQDYLFYNLIIQSFYELLFNKLPTTLTLQRFDDVLELDLRKNRNYFGIALLANIKSLPEVLSGKTMIGLSKELLCEQVEIRESLYKMDTINDIYQNYLKTPGNIHLKRKMTR